MVRILYPDETLRQIAIRWGVTPDVTVDAMPESEIEVRVAMAAGRLDRSVLYVTQAAAEASKRP